MKNKCKQCGAEWTPRVENPVQCPRCKRVDWKEVQEEKNKDAF